MSVGYETFKFGDRPLIGFQSSNLQQMLVINHSKKHQ